jgi:hypothetical protein
MYVSQQRAVVEDTVRAVSELTPPLASLSSSSPPPSHPPSQATLVGPVAGWKEGANEQHTGFITIDPKHNSNSFFWLSKSLDGNPDAPLLLWLQGGPGASSLFGLFTEIGPFNIGADMRAVPRGKNGWNNHYHLLFIDNPVGTGFSFTDDAGGYVQNQTQVGSDLHEALTQFFKGFPELKKNDFYVTGESYAGKYVSISGINSNYRWWPRIGRSGGSPALGATRRRACSGSARCSSRRASIMGRFSADVFKLE